MARFFSRCAVAETLFANRRTLQINDETEEYDRKIKDAWACYRKTGDMQYLHQAKYLELVKQDIINQLNER